MKGSKRFSRGDGEKGGGFFGFGKNVFVTGLVSFFMDISSEMIYPLVPLFLASVLGVNKSVIGLIEGIAESTASLIKVFSGWFSDRIGNRKWPMAAGYATSTLSRPLVALATGWQHVMGSRFMDRFGKGIRTAPRDAIIAEATDNVSLGKTFGFQRAMDSMGAVAGPALAFFLLSILANDYRKVFWLSMIPGGIAVLLTIFFITEPKKSAAVKTRRPKFALGQFDWKFRSFVIISALFAAGNSSDMFLILKARQTGVSTLLIPMVYLLFNLVYSLSSIPAGMAADRFGKRRIILLGFILFAFLYYGFAVASDTKTIWLLFALYGLFMGLTDGIQRAFIAAITPPDFKATAFGLYNTVVGLAMLPASLIGGWLWDNISPSATFYFGAATATVSAVLFMVFMIVSRTND